MERYDYCIIGGGPGGVEAAKILSELSKKVCIIEKNHIGGTCLNRGCIPAKAMLYSSELYSLTKKMGEYGININDVQYDYKTMVEKRDNIIEKLRKGLTFVLKNKGVEIIKGECMKIDENRIVLSDGRVIVSNIVIIATGGLPKTINFDDGNERVLTSDTVFNLDSLPKSITIIGGGPVGTEFATFFNRLGTRVTIIESSERLLHHFDYHLGDELTKMFKREGINTCINIKDITKADISLDLKSADYILCAIGTKPNTQFLDKILLNERGYVKVDNNFQTNLKNIYAIGDAIGLSGTAYGAEREGRYLAYYLLGKDISLTPVDYKIMPNIVFSYPEVATCGYKSKDLENIKYDIKTIQYIVNGKANIKDETRGKIWMYYEKDTGVILGVHIIGDNATELINMIPVVLQNKLTINDYLKSVWAHPVLSEVIKELMLG